MELGTFLNHATTREAVVEMVRETQPADLGYRGAEILPEQVLNVQNFSRNVIILSGAMIANDVAPLAEGVQKGGMRREKIGGGLIDSAAKMEYMGEDIEMLMNLVAEIRGDVVRAAMPELTAYLNLVNLHLNIPLVQNRERKRWTLMGLGKAYYDGARDEAFTKPPVFTAYAPSQIATVTQASGRSIYGGANANVIEDIRADVNAVVAAGGTVRAVWMSRQTLVQILSLDSTRQELGLLRANLDTGGQITVNFSQGVATQGAFEARLTELGLPPLEIYDGYWSDQVDDEADPVGSVGSIVNVKYIPDGRMVYEPVASPVDNATNEPTVPFRVTLFDRSRVNGVHVIGRQTAKPRPGINVYGPFFNDQTTNPHMKGDSSLAHLPFLSRPAHWRVRNYLKP